MYNYVRPYGSSIYYPTLKGTGLNIILVTTQNCYEKNYSPLLSYLSKYNLSLPTKTVHLTLSVSTRKLFIIFECKKKKKY